MNPFFWSSFAAFFINQQFKLKGLLNPDSTCLGQTHSVVTIFQAAPLIAGQTKPLTLNRFFNGVSFFLFGGELGWGGWGVGGNPTKDLNFATETHAAFNWSEKHRSQRWARTEVHQRGRAGPAARPPRSAPLCQPAPGQTCI